MNAVIEVVFSPRASRGRRRHLAWSCSVSVKFGRGGAEAVFKCPAVNQRTLPTITVTISATTRERTLAKMQPRTGLGKPASPEGDRRLSHNTQIRTLGAQPQLVSLFKCLRVPPTPESRGCGAALY